MPWIESSTLFVMSTPVRVKDNEREREIKSGGKFYEISSGPNLNDSHGQGQVTRDSMSFLSQETMQ